VSGLINQFDYEHLSSFPPARFPAFGVALHTHATHNCLIYYYLYLAFASLRNRFVSEWVSKYKFLNFYLCAFGLAAMISDPNASSFRGCPVPLFHIPPPGFDNLNNFAMWMSAVGLQYFNGLSLGARCKCSLVMLFVYALNPSPYLLLSMKYE